MYPLAAYMICFVFFRGTFLFFATAHRPIVCFSATHRYYTQAKSKQFVYEMCKWDVQRCDRDGIMEKTLIRLYRLLLVACHAAKRMCHSMLEKWERFHGSFGFSMEKWKHMLLSFMDAMMTSEKTTMFGLLHWPAHNTRTTRVLICNMFDDDRIVGFYVAVYDAHSLLSSSSSLAEKKNRRRTVPIITSCRLSRFTAIALKHYKTLHMAEIESKTILLLLASEFGFDSPFFEWRLAIRFRIPSGQRSPSSSQSTWDLSASQFETVNMCRSHQRRNSTEEKKGNIL